MPDRVRAYRATWDSQANEVAGLVEWGKQVLEDLWQEKQPQNVPGTDKERPNWQRKARFGLEAFCQMPSGRDTLQEMDFLRRQGK